MSSRRSRTTEDIQWFGPVHHVYRQSCLARDHRGIAAWAVRARIMPPHHSIVAIKGRLLDIDENHVTVILDNVVSFSAVEYDIPVLSPQEKIGFAVRARMTHT